jgi:hypothetical protein
MLTKQIGPSKTNAKILMRDFTKPERNINSSIFCDITSRRSPGVNRRFGGTRRLHIQSTRALLADCITLTCYLPYYFNLEDGGEIFLRKVC